MGSDPWGKSMADHKGIWFKIKSQGHAPRNKPRVYFTCHPEDFGRYFDTICEQVFKAHDCVICYTDDMSAPYEDENWQDDLAQMNLFIFPVTFNLLQGGNRALDTDLPFAIEHHIPVLPLMMEHGLGELFTQSFGKIQYLSPGQSDDTALSYEEKLDSFLDSVLIGDEIRKRIQAAFDAYIFLSYRKKDRKYANGLMRLIHKNPLCRDIAIWYDEFLVPGEDFNESIAEAMDKSSLFTLLVTPNLLEDQNYVMRVEYPEAKKAGKEILPVEMVQTDSLQMAAKYLGIPVSVKGQDDEEFRSRFLEGLKSIAVRENDTDPVHNFLIGLAYLNGIDVEKDNSRAVEMITSAAEANLPEAMDKLAGMYEDAEGVDCNYREAIKWRERLLEWAKKDYQSDNPDHVKIITKNMSDLAYAYSVNGEYRKAFPLYERVYEIRKENFGEDAKITLRSLMNLATVYGNLGDYKKDLELEKQIYLKCKAKYGAGDRMSLNLLGNISFLYEKLGKYQKSLELDRILYERYKKIHGEEHPDTLLAQNNLGVAYAKVGDESKAISILENVYEKRKLVCGEDHPDTLVTMSSLAVTIGALGNTKKELEIEQELYEKRRKTLGEEHPNTLTTLGNLAMTYGENGDHKKESELEEKLYKLRKKVLGENHPDTLRTLNNLATSYGNQGDFQKASEMLKNVYESRKNRLGEEHPDTLSTLGNLAYAYGKSGDLHKEMELEQVVYETRKRTLGEEHPDTKLALKNLAYTYRDLGDFEKSEELLNKLGQ
jgi:tetratricopeptide (TPR) repeat protein